MSSTILFALPVFLCSKLCFVGGRADFPRSECQSTFGGIAIVAETVSLDIRLGSGCSSGLSYCFCYRLNKGSEIDCYRVECCLLISDFIILELPWHEYRLTTRFDESETEKGCGCVVRASSQSRHPRVAAAEHCLRPEVAKELCMSLAHQDPEAANARPTAETHKTHPCNLNS